MRRSQGAGIRGKNKSTGVAAPVLPEQPNRLPDRLHEVFRDVKSRQAELELQLKELRRMKQELEQTQERYLHLSENGAAAYLVKDADGHITRANQRARDLLGYSDEQLTGKHVLDLCPDTPQGKARAGELFAKFKAGEPITDAELLLETSSGELRWISLSVHPETDENGKLLGSRSMLVDVTALHQIEEARLQSEEQYRALVEDLPIGAYRTSPDGRLLSVNNAMVKMFGYSSAGEIMAVPVADLYADPERRETLLHLIQTAPTSGHHESKMRRKDGSTFWISSSVHIARDNSGEILYFDGVARDISEQRRIHETLSKSEQNFKALYMDAPLGYQSLDENGCVQEVNNEWLRIFGYRREEVLGRSFGDFFTPENRHKFAAMFSGFRTQGEIHGAELELQRKDGSRFLVDYDGRIAYDDQGHFRQTHCVMHDVTDRRRAEAALIESQERLQLAMEGAGLGMWDHNLRTGEVVRSDTWSEMLGYAPGEIAPTDQGWKQLIHPDDLALTEKIAAAHEAGEIPEFKVEHRMKARDGQWRWILNWGKVTERADDGTELRATGIHLDITDRKRTEQALRESEERYRTLQDNVPIGVYRSTPEGQLLSVNIAMARMFGYESPDELMAVPAWDLYVYPEQRHRLVDRLSTHGSDTNLEFEMKRKDGSSVWMAISGQAVRRPDGTVSHFDGVIKDISERKGVEQKISRINDVFVELGVDSAKNTEIIVRETCHLLEGVVSLYNRLDHPERFETHWSDVNAPAIGEDRDVPNHPMCFAMTVNGKSDLLAIPDLAESDFAGVDPQIDRLGLRSYLGHPVRINGETIGVLAVVDSKPRQFTETDIEIISTMAKALSLEEERARARAAVEERLKFETLLADLSAAFVGARASELSTEIERWLARFVNFLDIDRSTVMEFVDDPRGSRIIYAWTVDTKSPSAGVVSADHLPWIVSKLRRGELVLFESHNDLPKEAAADRKEIAKGDLRSAVAIPLSVGGEILGAVAFGCINRERTWSDEIVQRLRLVAEVFANVLNRKRAEDAIRDSEARWRSLTEDSPDYVVTLDCDLRILYANHVAPGLTMESIVGQPLYSFDPPEVRDDVRRALEGVLSTRQPITYETTLETPGDTTIYFESRAVPRVVADEVVGLTVSARDITKRKQGENRLRRIVQNMPVMMDAMDEEGNILTWNDECERVTGYSADEIVGNPRALDLLYPDLQYREHMLKLWADIGNDFREMEWDIVCKDGSVRTIAWFNISGQFPLPGWSSWAIGVDVTKRKRAEIALRASEERFRSIFENSTIGIYRTTPDGRILMANPALLDMLGYTSLIELGDRNLEDEGFGPDDHRTEFRTRMERDGEVKGFESGWLRRDGTLLYVRESARAVHDTAGNTLYYEGTVENYTERKKAEEALRESEGRLRTVFETAQDAIFIKNLNMRYVSVNPAMCRLVNLPSSQIIGRTDREVFGLEAANHTQEIDASVLDGEISNEEDSQLILGQRRSLHVVKVPMRDSSGGIVGLCGIARDVTEMRRLQQMSDRAQRLETAGRIAGQVAHDFNNLLGPMLAYPDFIRDELEAGHPALTHLDDIEAAAEQMAEINQQLLTLGRRGHYNQEPLNINSIIYQVLERIGPHPETLVIETDLADNLLHIKGGASQIHRVMSNLISNAWDAMQGIGRLGITSENVYVDTVADQYERVPQGEYVKVSITDSGCGIPQDILPRIFDPFFTTKVADKRRGSGLGLSVVHAVVKDHHGYVDVESTVVEGTTFYLYFPITRETPMPADSDEIIGGTEKVLVIDDDQIQREVSIRLLTKLGYHANAVESGEQAIEYLRGRPQDLIILDMVMPPGLDGADTLREIRRDHPHQRAIMVSGFAESERVEEALRLGAGAFVRKPLTLKTTAMAVRRELDREE
ncbi:MAG: PAS domain S-box protein [candidate division Zixibacteria bacterium]|nr:PAS domain S-box protein [candidate division Zixibacteria bacterium]